MLLLPTTTVGPTQTLESDGLVQVQHLSKEVVHQMKYPIAERFKAPQGEGLYTGVPMAFIRLVGCSVGQGVCTACDTNFEKMYPELGGGLYTTEELLAWAGNYIHVCLTGGEPLDRNLLDLVNTLHGANIQVHIETSGTLSPLWLNHMPDRPWLCVSPKPGYLRDMIEMADEIKVILGGLGDGPGWPTVDNALTWAAEGRLVYIQPRNSVLTIDKAAMDEAITVVSKHPSLRLSAQLHKYLRTR